MVGDGDKKSLQELYRVLEEEIRGERFDPARKTIWQVLGRKFEDNSPLMILSGLDHILYKNAGVEYKSLMLSGVEVLRDSDATLEKYEGWVQRASREEAPVTLQFLEGADVGNIFDYWRHRKE